MKRTLLITSCTLTILISQPLLAKDYGWMDPLLSKKNIHSAPVMACSTPIPVTRTLTLSDVAYYALCNNPQTRGSWASVMAQAARLGSSRAAYLPTISGSAVISRSTTESGTTKSTEENLTPSASLSYLLLDFGGRSATVESTRQGLFAADYSHNATLQNVLFTAIQAYYQLYSSLAAVDAAGETVRSTQASLDAAKLRYEVGVATIADQLQAETVNAQAVLRREQANNQARINRGVLANALGVSPDYAFKIDTSTPKELDISFSDDIAAMLAEAKKNRPDLAASEAQLGSARANVRVQSAGGLPYITAAAAKSKNENLSGSGSDRDTSTLSATVHVPLFTGFSRSYQIRAAREDFAAQEASTRETENDILLDVWRTYNNYQTTKQTLTMTDTLLTSATKSEQVALERYRAGVGSITDLLTAQAQLADARQQQIQSHYNWLIAKADMLRALGCLNKDSVKGTS